MKSLTLSLYLSLFVFIACAAQETNASKPTSISLEKNVSQADLIVEGHVVSTKVFTDKGNAYTSAIIRITKVFKGNTSDSAIELIYAGGIADSIAVRVTHGLGLSPGMEGVFFLRENKSDAKFVNGMKSFKAVYGRKSYIEYHDQAHMVAHHTATCVGVAYDDLENDLFKPIEATTGISRKVIGPNMFERKLTKTLQDNR
jgi:hypothetical protein